MRDGGGAEGAPRLRYSQSGEHLQRDSCGGLSVVGEIREAAIIEWDPATQRALR
ncbi:hypothetical protein [Burkholderia sp. NLJ2]|uniref:hypothetical protein n=1 Tax=Burkholderia sp. NLJ2 TaxID=3090699 RepID=UPI003C6C9DD3